MDRESFIKEQQRKKRIRQRKLRRARFFALVVVLFIIILVVSVSNKPDTKQSPENNENITVNDVIYPTPPPTIPDLITAINKPDGVKECYLTFDDGPTNSITTEILDVLRRYDVKATFFTVGTLLEKNPDTARRVYDEGHLLANHSYSHNYSNLYADETSFMNEINQTYKLICDITGDANYPHVFRFPGGGFNSGSHGEAKQSYKNALAPNNIRYCDWNALNGDAEGGSPSAEELVQRVKKSSNNKEDIVILMHDAATKKTTAESLPEVIEYLKSQGYIFKTLDQAPRF